MTLKTLVGRERGQKGGVDEQVHIFGSNTRSTAIEKLAAELFPAPNPMPAVFPSASEMIRLSRTLK